MRCRMANSDNIVDFFKNIFLVHALASLKTDLTQVQCELLSCKINGVTFKIRFNETKLRYIKIAYLPVKDIFTLECFDPYNTTVGDFKIDITTSKELYYDLIGQVNSYIYETNKQQIADKCADIKAFANKDIQLVMTSLFSPLTADIGYHVIENEVIYQYFIDQLTYPIVFGINEQIGDIRVGYNSEFAVNTHSYNSIESAICGLIDDIVQFTGTDGNQLFLYKIMDFISKEMDFYIQAWRKRNQPFSIKSDMNFTTMLKNIYEQGFEIDVKKVQQNS